MVDVVETPGLLIGELASLAGVTARTIRHYERLGLIGPAGRDANGYRRYDHTALRELAEIRRLRSLGLSIADVAALRAAGAGELEDVALMQRLDELQAGLDEEIDELRQRRARVGELREAVAEGDAVLSTPTSRRFDVLAETLSEAGATPEAIAEQRRLWAALEAIGLPDTWETAIADGLTAMTSRPELVAAVVEKLELLARLRDIDPDDPLVEEAAGRLAGLVEDHEPDSPVALLDDDAAASILHLVASCLSPAQLRAAALMIGVITEPSASVAAADEGSLEPR